MQPQGVLRGENVVLAEILEGALLLPLRLDEKLYATGVVRSYVRMPGEECLV